MFPESPYSEQEEPFFQFASLNTKSEEVLDSIVGECSAEMSDSSTMLGFLFSDENDRSHVEHDEPGCSYGFAPDDPSYEKALAECHIIRENPLFAEGILLKCVDKCSEQPFFPYLHIASFSAPEHNYRIREVKEVIKECRINSKSLYGVYDEVYSIQKSASIGESRLPTNRHAGFVIIGFKLLDDSNQQAALERTWLSWSGAREIYKFAPRSWNLKRISLVKYPPHARNGSTRPFVYVLLCEFGSILHPSNNVQALDLCERLRVRNCGHIALYQVQTVYSSPQPTTPVSRSRLSVTGSPISTLGSTNGVSTSPSPSSTTKRHPMARGFSQDVEHHPRGSPGEQRRARMLRSRERSFQYPDDHYHAYNQY